MEKNQEFTVSIEDISEDGAGIGKLDGYIWFIKDAVIGDVVRARAMKMKKNYGFARLMEILTPSAARVEPRCPVARQCGGCQLQNLPYAEQLLHKQRRAVSVLGELGHVENIIGMDEPAHYRNKVHAALAYDRAKNKTISGIYQPGSHRIVPVDECMIEDKLADEIIVDIRRMLPEFKIQVFDERGGSGWLRHILIRRGFATGEVMVVLVAVSPIFKLQKPFLKKLLEKHPEITTVVLNINDRFGPVILGTREKVIYGSGYIEDVLCGVTSRHVGRPVRVQFTVGGGPAAPVRRAPVRPAPRPTPAPSADDYERPPLPEEAPPAPPDLPPWEVPAPHRDKLDELVENAKQLDNFRIK